MKRAFLAFLALLTSSAVAGPIRVEPAKIYGKGIVTASAISPGGKRVVVAAANRVLALDGDTFEVVATPEPSRDGIIRDLAVSDDGVWVAAYYPPKTVRLWSLEEPTFTVAWTVEPPELQEPLFSVRRNGERMIVQWRSRRSSKRVSASWRSSTGETAFRRTESDAERYEQNRAERFAELRIPPMEAFAAASDAPLIAGWVESDGSRELQVWRFEADAAQKIATAPVRSAKWHQFSGSGRFLVIGTYDRAGVMIFDMESNEVVSIDDLTLTQLAACDLPLPSHRLTELSALQGDYVFAGRPLAGELVRILPDDRKAWARRWIISQGMRSCDAMPPQIEASYRDQWHELPDLAFAYSRPRRTWAIAISRAEGVPESTHHIVLWQNDTHERLGTLKGHELRFSGDNDTLRYVHFLDASPDGRYLVSGGEDGTTRLWDLETRRELARVEGHVAPALFVAFDPSGRRFLSGSRDGTVREWRIVGGG